MTELNLGVPKEYRDHLKLGTCSWKYDSWRGLVYPPEPEPISKSYLAEYAAHFNTVEVDQWFWSLFPTGVKLPDHLTVQSYAGSVPDGFLFAVKAPNAITLTHFYSRQPKRHADYADRPNEHFLSLDLLRRFLDRLSPLGSRLGPIMFQFEYLNKKKMPSLAEFLDRLDEFFSAAPSGYRYAVEIRNANYLRPELFAFLREHGVGYVFIEGYYMPPIAEVFGGHDAFTSDFVVVRLHGPDRSGVEKKTGKQWDQIVQPQPEGLQAATEIIRSSASRGLLAMVYVNNHFEGSAPLTIARLLGSLRDDSQV